MADLEEKIPQFGGQATRVRCFLHVTNLVAKSLIRQFDLPKRSAVGADDDDMALRELASNIEMEELLSRNDELKLGNGCEADDTEGWIDERAGLSPEDRAVLDRDIRPLRMILVKVCCETENYVLV